MSADLCPVCARGRPRFCCRALLYAGREGDIHDCPDCGAAFYRPMPSYEEIARCYPPVYFRDFLKQYWKDVYKGRALARRLAPWKASGDMLDVGCALGTMLAGAREGGWRVKGLEFSPEAAALGSSLNGVEIVSAPLSKAPWPDASFDFVHVNNVLEHEADPEGALRAVARLLRPCGRMELTVPNGPVDLLPNRTLLEKWGRAVVTRHGGHLFFFSRRALGELLSRCGLEMVSTRCFHLKQGAKARGWLPHSYKIFAKGPRPLEEGRRETLTLEQAKALIPPRPSWPLYWARYRWRRLWRTGLSDFGYDFEILAEKRR